MIQHGRQPVPKYQHGADMLAFYAAYALPLG
jgi:hypothetical protein